MDNEQILQMMEMTLRKEGERGGMEPMAAAMNAAICTTHVREIAAQVGQTISVAGVPTANPNVVAFYIPQHDIVKVVDKQEARDALLRNHKIEPRGWDGDAFLTLFETGEYAVTVPRNLTFGVRI